MSGYGLAHSHIFMIIWHDSGHVQIQSEFTDWEHPFRVSIGCTVEICMEPSSTVDPVWKNLMYIWYLYIYIYYIRIIYVLYIYIHGTYIYIIHITHIYILHTHIYIYIIIHIYIYIWLVVDLPLWKIWKSIGIIIPNIWKIFQTTNHIYNIYIFIS